MLETYRNHMKAIDEISISIQLKCIVSTEMGRASLPLLSIGMFLYLYKNGKENRICFRSATSGLH